MESKILADAEAVDPEQCICFKEGILGFPDIKNYLLLAHEAGQAFFQLRSVDDPDLSFVVMDPLVFAPDYQPAFSGAELESLEITDPASMVILSIVSVPQDDPLKMTANLMAPLLINTQTRQGRQIVLSHADYAIREAVIKD